MEIVTRISFLLIGMLLPPRGKQGWWLRMVPDGHYLTLTKLGGVLWKHFSMPKLVLVLMDVRECRHVKDKSSVCWEIVFPFHGSFRSLFIGVLVCFM